jgi:hypothetical protein
LAKSRQAGLTAGFFILPFCWGKGQHRLKQSDAAPFNQFVQRRQCRFDIATDNIVALNRDNNGFGTGQPGIGVLHDGVLSISPKMRWERRLFKRVIGFFCWLHRNMLRQAFPGFQCGNDRINHFLQLPCLNLHLRGGSNQTLLSQAHIIYRCFFNQRH